MGITDAIAKIGKKKAPAKKAKAKKTAKDIMTPVKPVADDWVAQRAAKRAARKRK